jgi:TolA-binding protein
MTGTVIRRRSLAIGAIVLGLATFVSPAWAQTGQVKGKVVDANNQPIEKATVTIEGSDSGNRKYTVTTNKKGEYIQIGLQVGTYKVTASKDGMSQTFTQRIGLDMAEINFALKPGSTGDVSEADRKKAEAKMAAVKTAFEAGVGLANEGKHDEAIAKFNEVIAQLPKCAECYSNIGGIYYQKKEYDQAETAFSKAIELNPNAADAYNGLANVYNSQKKFDKAAEASKQAMKLSGGAAGGAAAGAGASASSVFNQAVILWNAGKYDEAKAQFEETVRIDPKFADAHYWLGMSILRDNKMQEAGQHFEEYLKLAPTGQYAEQAKSILTTIKK